MPQCDVCGWKKCMRRVNGEGAEKGAGKGEGS